MWTLALEHHEDRAPTHGYAGTREAAMSRGEQVGGAPAALGRNGRVIHVL